MDIPPLDRVTLDGDDRIHEVKRRMNRRHALGLLAASTGAVTLSRGATAAVPASPPRCQMGLVTYALGIHQRNRWDGRYAGLSPALALLEGSHALGAGGIQVDLAAEDRPHLNDLRERAERYGMYVEAIMGPPQDGPDVERFEQAILDAQQAGATLARTVILPGRRYERFTSLDEFRELERRGEQSLERAEPILRRHRFRLAVENHKDQRTWEKVAMLERVSSEYIGMCVDLGNNFPLLEDPLFYVRAFAPWAFSVHLKDQAVRESEDGYWFADVALGEGFLDLPAMVSLLREANPDVRFNFETITRDAIAVPVLSEGFWATLEDTPASALARTLRVVKTQAYSEPFAMVSALPRADQIALERRNIETSVEYARSHLGL